MAKVQKIWVSNIDTYLVVEYDNDKCNVLASFPTGNVEEMSRRADAFIDGYNLGSGRSGKKSYPGAGIFSVNVTEDSKVKAVWLVTAASAEQAEEKFRKIDEEEKAEGDKPLILSNQEISIEPLEFERGICQMW